MKISDRPVLLIGGLAPNDRGRVREFVRRLNAPVYAEPLSGLREDESLRDLLVLNERSLHRGQFTQVIRIGNVPTLRFWRDLDRLAIEVISFSRLSFAGLSRGEVFSFDSLSVGAPAATQRQFFETDRAQREAFELILDQEPTSELAMMRQLSRDLSEGARIYLGNSLPIREWDLVATREQRHFEIGANRGANGIDGQLSTFFGWCAPNSENVAIVGDLTALYDLNAPWIVPQLDAKFRIVIINNHGGRIFERVPVGAPRLAVNDHSISFEHWASMFGIDVVELRPDLDATRRVWQRYDELWR